MADTRSRLEALRLYGLLLVDHVIAALIVAPLVVGYWRATWLLSDLYIFPDDTEKSLWTSLVIGVGGVTSMCLLQGTLLGLSDKLRQSRLWWFLGNHLYTYIMAFFCVCSWRGHWVALDHYTGMGLYSNVASFLIGTGVLCFTRSSKNAISAPMLIAMDTDSGFFSYTTRFRTKPKDGENYVLDVILTTIVISAMITYVWRGAWGIEDNLLFPNNLERSALASIILAAVIIVISIILEISLLCFQKRLHGKVYWCFFIESALIIFGNIGTITCWRGIWNLIDIHIYPETPYLRGWLVHYVSCAVLMIALCGNSLLLKDINLDGDVFQREASHFFPNRYVRYFLSNKARPVQSPEVAVTGEEKPADNEVCVPLKGNGNLPGNDVTFRKSPSDDKADAIEKNGFVETTA